MVVDVVTAPGAVPGNHVVKAVHCGGADIFWMDGPDYAAGPNGLPFYRQLDLTDFEEDIAEQMVVPEGLLTINYVSFSPEGGEVLHFPYGWTTRKN